MTSRLSAILLSLFSGALAVLAFAPFGYWPIQIFSLAIVFYLVLRANTVRRSALIGWAYGFGWSIFCIHWLFVSMHRHGGLPTWMAIMALILMALVLGSFSALAMASSTWLRQRLSAPALITALFIIPSCWALFEWLRGWIFTGLPWGATGYAHVTSPLAGFAPIVGVYGVGWLAALTAGCIAFLPFRQTGGRIFSLLVFVCIFSAGFIMKGTAWTEPHKQPIQVRLLQTNVPQEAKFAPAQLTAMLSLNHDMIMAQPADLIATPETAIPLFEQQLPSTYLPALQDYSNKTGSHLLNGIPLYDGPQTYTNSVIGIAPNTDRQYRYNKHHLVPFGEFVPPGSRWFINMMRIPLGDFTSGAAVQAPFAVKDQWVLPNICYEDLFGEEIAAQIATNMISGQPQTTILLNMSNIAWFGDTIALPQHLQISQMRALETGRPMLRSTNTGMTAIINPQGKVVAQLQPYTRATLAASVQGYHGATPYIRFGNAIMLALTLGSLIAAWLLTQRARRRNIWH